MAATKAPILASLILPLLAVTAAAQAPSPPPTHQTAADAIAACRTARDSRQRLTACSAVIADAAATPAQKLSAYRNRGRARAEAGAFADAIADLTEAIKLNADDPHAFIARAGARMGAGDAAGAIADYDAVIRLKPGWAIGHLGRGHANLVAGRADAAVADFTRAIETDRDNAPAFNNRGLAYRKLGNPARAIEDYTAAITLNPIYAQAYANRGYAHEERGDKDKAVDDFRRALLVDPSIVGARNGLQRLGAMGSLAGESARLVAEGKVLVEKHCQGCHAVAASGDSPNPKAPTFRSIHERHPMLALRSPLTRGIAAPHDVMPKFKLADADVDKIVAYINSLGVTR
jgi:tetratricopeptide (TPR) repeat protein